MESVDILYNMRNLNSDPWANLREDLMLLLDSMPYSEGMTPAQFEAVLKNITEICSINRESALKSGYIIDFPSRAPWGGGAISPSSFMDSAEKLMRKSFKSVFKNSFGFETSVAMLARTPFLSNNWKRIFVKLLSENREFVPNMIEIIRTKEYKNMYPDQRQHQLTQLNFMGDVVYSMHLQHKAFFSQCFIDAISKPWEGEDLLFLLDLMRDKDESVIKALNEWKEQGAGDLADVIEQGLNR